MASTVALFSGLSGLNANSRGIEVAGHNIANANTTGFKSSRILYESAFSWTLREATSPGDTTGGTNPTQIGLGVKVAGTTRDMNQGTVTLTGDARDMAIEGDGFFIVDRAGAQRYTRAGAFRQDADRNLVSVDGDYLMGYGVDENYNILEGALTTLRVPLGARSVAEQTTLVRFAGNLNAAGALPAGGSVIDLMDTTGAGLAQLTGTAPPPAAGNVVEMTTLLTQIEDALAPGSSMFTSGQTIELQGAARFGGVLPTAQLTVGAATTVQDFLTFLNGALGIQTTGGANPDGRTPGVTIDPTTGAIQVVGNTGEVNGLELPANALRVLDAAGDFVRSPFATAEIEAATGESVRTTYVAYDSLGSLVEAELGFVLESKTDQGTTWRWFADSDDDTNGGPAIATGLVRFDTSGQLIDDEPLTITIDRSGSGAGTPITFTVDLAEGEERVTALAAEQSELASVFRDGQPSGTLQDFGVDRDGTVLGSFSNGLVRPLGRVVLATFANDAGLRDEGDNVFAVTANSGDAIVANPTTLGTGAITGGALENSNVDLGREFVTLITASTGYSAASRVIRTADELFQTLIALAR